MLLVEGGALLCLLRLVFFEGELLFFWLFLLFVGFGIGSTIPCDVEIVEGCGLLVAFGSPIASTSPVAFLGLVSAAGGIMAVEFALTRTFSVARLVAAGFSTGFATGFSTFCRVNGDENNGDDL